MEGVELPREWVGKAEVFLREAERHVGEGIYWLACFESQQAAELYLKALIVGLAGAHPYTHDIVELLETIKGLGIEVPEELVLYGDSLTPHYTLARYPGRKPFEYNRGRGLRCLEQAKSIAEWVERVADPQTPSLYRVLAERMKMWGRAFGEFVEALCREDIVVEAYLVGSRARGDHLPYSDYDVVVVVPGHVDKLEATVRLRRLKRSSFPLDLIVLHSDEADDRLYQEMMRTAKRLCGRQSRA